MAAGGEEDRGGSPDVAASKLDDKTHSELRLLYQDSAAAVRFAKDRQWKLVGGTLLLFAAVIALPELISLSVFAAKGLVLVSLLISAAAIYILTIYQVWQSTELGRLQSIGNRFSSVFAQIGGRQAKHEAKVHGYIILFFMIVAVVAANAVTVVLLSRLYL